MLWHNNTTWDENLIGKTTVVDGEEVIDTVAYIRASCSCSGSS